MTLGLARWLSLFASAVTIGRRKPPSYPSLDLRHLSERDIADLNLPEDFAAKVRRHSMFRHTY
jgi:hypothetical protein